MLILALPKVHVENENKEFVDDIKRFCMIAYFESFYESSFENEISETSI